MAKNIFTGLDEEEIITPLESEEGATNSVVNPEGIGGLFGGEKTLKTEIPKTNPLEELTGDGIGTQKPIEITPQEEIVPKIPEIGDPTQIGNQGLGEAEDIEIKDEGTTGIEVVDTELDKLNIEKEKEIKDTYDSYNLAKGEFEKNKGYYINFDETNTIFEGVLSDMRNIQESEGITDLSDEQLQIIADKYGLDINDVKNPQNIFNKLQLTDEGKKELGITGVQDQINTLTTDFERNKEDLAFTLEGQVENINNQISDTETQLERNVDFFEASGAWSGGGRSTGFQQGLENIKGDSETTIGRMQNLLEKTNEANTTNLERLTEDYDTAIASSKEELDSNLRDLKLDMGIQLSGLSEQYGLGSTELTNALDAITEEFGIKSMEVFNNYLTNMRSIQDITASNIEQQEVLLGLIDEKSNKRYNELIANDGLLIQNTSLKGLKDDLDAGTLSLTRYNDLKNIMTSSITNTLSQLGTINQTDLGTIETLLNQGKTPTEIVTQMQGLDKFTSTEEGEIERIDLGGGKIRIVNADGSIEDYQDGELITEDMSTITNVVDFIKSSEGFVGQAYDDATGKVLLPGETPVGTATIGYGFTTINGQPIKAGDTITQEEADLEFTKQIENYKNFENLITVPLTENQKTALTSFEYNLGSGVWDESASDIIEAINNNDFEEAGRIMNLYNQAGGEFVQGLQNRRNEEVNLLTSIEESPNFEEKLSIEEQQNKDLIISQIKYGLVTPSEISGFRDLAIEQGWAEELTKNISDKGLKDIAEAEDDLRKEFESKPSIEAYREAMIKNSQLISSLGKETGPGDVASVFNFMKSLDPGSVVRESEFQVAAESSGILDRVYSLQLLQRAKEGDILTEKQRKEFGEVAKQLIKIRQEDFDETVEYYRNLAKGRLLNPDNVVQGKDIIKTSLTEEEIAEIKADTKEASRKKLVELGIPGYADIEEYDSLFN